MNNHDLGYSPANLRTLKQLAGITYEDIAAQFQCALSTVKNWAADKDKPKHRPMSWQKWLFFLQWISPELADSEIERSAKQTIARNLSPTKKPS